MSLVRAVALLLAATLLASPALADPFRMSAKVNCFQPNLSSSQKSVGFVKKSHASSGFIADSFEISMAEAKELDLVYDPVVAKLSIVKRCDGTLVQQLAHLGGAATSTAGPIGGNQKAAQTMFLLTDSPWGVFASSGGISCRFFEKLEASQITGLTGLCKGTIRAFGQNCDAQFAPIGTFTPGPGCM